MARRWLQLAGEQACREYTRCRNYRNRVPSLEVTVNERNLMSSLRPLVATSSHWSILHSPPWLEPPFG